MRSQTQRRLPYYQGEPYLGLDFFFFFQAEDGIRDLTVTGVQTCALPIWGVLGSVSDRLPATIRSRFPSPSTSSAMIPRIGAICARLGSGTDVNVPSPLF